MQWPFFVTWRVNRAPRPFWPGLRSRVPRITAILMSIGVALGCAGAPTRGRPPSAQTASDNADAHYLYVARRGWHVDIGLSVAELHGKLAAIAAQWPEATHVVVGFGDRRYLLSRAARSCTGVTALWPGPALVLVTAIHGDIAHAFGDGRVLTIRVDGAQRRRAEEFIVASIANSDRARAPEAVASGPYAGSAYYAATASYSGVHTCNTWAAEVLAAAGLPVGTTGVVLAGQVWRRARRCTSQDAESKSISAPCAATAR